MPVWQSIRLPAAALMCLASLILQAGCFKASPPVDWSKAVQGTYKGAAGGFDEVLEIKSDGSFWHAVFLDQALVDQETGQWRLEKGELTIVLEPFTYFYDWEKQSVTRTGDKAALGALFFLREGVSVKGLSPTVTRAYLLKRAEAGTVAAREERPEPK